MNELYKVCYNFENVPKFMQVFAGREFMRNRSVMVKVYNEHIDVINRIWDSYNEPAVLGEWDDDLNPKYGCLIKDYLSRYFRKANRKFPLVKYSVEEKTGDIIGYIPWLKGSKIWITLILC